MTQWPLYDQVDLVGSRSSRDRVEVEWVEKRSCSGRGDRVEVGMVVGLKSWRSREWSYGGRERSSSGWKKSCTAVGRAWSGNLGDRDDRIDLIGFDRKIMFK